MYLWQSTDKGGQFYGMQNVLAQTTSGMASNLKDAIDTMYYDIAKSNSGVIKGAIKDITELVSHWRELTSVLTAGTAAYGLYWSKMAMLTTDGSDLIIILL
jgi:pantothenate kinase type III